MKPRKKKDSGYPIVWPIVVTCVLIGLYFAYVAKPWIVDAVLSIGKQ